MKGLVTTNRYYCDAVDHFGLSDHTDLRRANMAMYGVSELGHAFMQHYRGGSGVNLEIPAQGIIANDEGIRRAIIYALNWRADMKSGIINISRSDYADYIYRDAFGDMCLQWEVTADISNAQNGTWVVDIWFNSRYTHKAIAPAVLDANMHKPVSGAQYDLIGKRVFFIFVRYSTGRTELQYAAQGTPYLTRLRQTHSDDYYLAVPVTTLYPHIAGYFYAEANALVLPYMHVQRRNASFY